jgi:predicted nuclease of predicted toxin-antitoxin system
VAARPRPRRAGSAKFTPDPGDAALLALAVEEQRILVTIDTDFATLVYVGGAAHAGIVRLPDFRTPARIALVAEVLARYGEADLAGAIVTVAGKPHPLRPHLVIRCQA